MIAVTIPIRTRSTLNQREHWATRAKRTKSHRQAAKLAWRRARPPPLPVRVLLVRVAPRALDGDNLQGALKAVRDGVADWLGVDDRDPRIRWEYEQLRGKPGEYAVRIEVSDG